MVGHQREHVVFHVVVHVPIEVAVDGVHVDRPAVEPMVEHVFGKTRVLGMAVDELEPTAVKGRQPDEHQRKDAARVDRKADDARVDDDVDAGPDDDLAILRFRNEGLFFRAKPSGAVEEHVAEEGERRIDAEESQEQGEKLRRPGHGDLRVASDNDRVAVVAGVAPTPTGGFPQDHEGGDLVEGVVHPVRLERRAVSRFVPAGVGGRGVEDAVDREREDGPPGAPEHETADAGADDQREPKERVADGGAIPALSSSSRILSFGTRRGVPCRFGQALFNGQLRCPRLRGCSRGVGWCS